MKINFLGASRTVTGSCYVVEAGGVRFAVDCGMHQGNRDIEKRNRDMAPYEPEKIEFVLVTHAHIDHTGLLPRLVKHGFKGPIYCTPPTADLLEIMLLDSAHIQEMEAEWENKKRLRHGRPPVEALYTKDDVTRTLPLIKPVAYNAEFEPAAGVKVLYRDAGHILGSAFINVTAVNNGSSTSLVFSGDLGRPNQLLVSDPEVARSADYLFVESTYGDRDHKNEENSRDELAAAIAHAYKNREKCIIPAFAVERSQEIIYTLWLLAKEGKLPKEMPVFLDSPLAIRATEIFKKHPEYMDDEVRELMQNGDSPFDLPNLVYTRSTADSQRINEHKGAAVVISASGMCNAGRIKHHLRHNLWRHGASIVFVGFQAQGTPGRHIVDGAKKIRLLGEEVAVHAKVFTIGGFSAHAGQSQIMEWIGNFDNPGMEVFLVHGEQKAQTILSEMIRERYGLTVHVPDYLEEVELKPGKAPAIQLHPERARPRIDWGYLVGETERLLEGFKGKLGDVQAKPWVDQTEMRDRLLDAHRALMELVSEN
ncbi:Beta-Casp domain containing protein [Alkalidesulfovibrio alkalitolerans DSM 16529]|uniref:Beta-Casp domain containing protein n=1 Tax=Alkalidesulfovibrio alkalitolerans DSM 16529 TaxID=1121439 RepID=S7T507_9BACT|nr:MBL fold metallo-hydrolase [Alkalidesulfovibrio alkalitolerans]EPR31585.1 Beta-Casp domain containing protein [Alkalidesulfovibrio alkalitolerans DSM 16529]